jgi:hypothetical protein
MPENYVRVSCQCGVNTLNDFINAIPSSTVGALVLSLAALFVPLYFLIKKGQK